MSFNGFSWLRSVRDAKASTYELSVATALAIRADEAGACWPSVETLAREAGLSETRARQSLKWLTERGFLRTRGDQPSKGRVSNTYTLQPITTRRVADQSAIAQSNPAPCAALPVEPITPSRVQPIAPQPVAPQPVAGRTPTLRPAVSNPAPGAPKCTQEDPQELTQAEVRAGAREQAAAAAPIREPKNLADALAMPIGERAKVVERDEFLAAFVQPHEWPEVRQIAEALQGGKVKLGQYSRDAGVKAVVGLFAAGYSLAELQAVVDRVTREKWWREGGKARGLSSLSPEVVRRALASTAPPKRDGMPDGWTKHPGLPGLYLDDRGQTRRQLPPEYRKAAS